MKQFSFLMIIYLTFIGCQEPSKENSKYNDLITSLEAKWAEVDSSYKIFQEIDHDKFNLIIKESGEKYSQAKKQYVSDTVIPAFDQVLALFKGNYVKGLKNISSSQKSIEAEYPVSAEQVKNLTHDFIHETVTEDTAKIYFNSEMNALTNLLLETNAYNSKATMTLNSYDSMSNALDSIVLLYGKK